MDAIDTNGWFTELPPMWPGQAFYQKVREDIVYKKPDVQDVKTKSSIDHGRLHSLDDKKKRPERDEKTYQEMATFLPLNSHPNPEKVLVLGGNNGGIIKELARHPKVMEIYHCKIDETLNELNGTYSPPMRRRSSLPNVKYFTKYEEIFSKSSKEKFDVIMEDASDPFSDRYNEKTKIEALSNTLFNDQLYEKLKQLLKPGGILCCQGENIWLHSSRIAKRIEKCLVEYPVVDYAYICDPTYPNGQIGFILCSLNEKTNFREPLTKWNEDDMNYYSLKYYCEDAHRAAFILPPFMKKLLQ